MRSGLDVLLWKGFFLRTRRLELGRILYFEGLDTLSRHRLGSFDPLLGPSGYNLLPAIVYGRTGGDADGQDFSGMYCAVLIIRSVVVSAGVLRIFGQEVAELPLIATTKDGRGKGYCRCLFLLIESLLSFLGVDNLIIPATEEAAPMLTRKFGFTKTPLDKVWKYAQDFSPIVLAGGASMYEKSIARIKS